MDTHKSYTTTDKSILIIVETLKVFRTILLGINITVYTYHLNIMQKSMDHKFDFVLRQMMRI